MLRQKSHANVSEGKVSPVENIQYRFWIFFLFKKNPNA